jgi:hypothetical protein
MTGRPALTYLVLRNLAHWQPDAISAACGCIISATLIVAMLFEDGNPWSLHDRIDHEIFSAHGHMNVAHEMAGLPQSELSHPARRHIRGVSQPAAQVLDSAASPAAS